MIDFSDSHPSDRTPGQRNQADNDAPVTLASTIRDDDASFTVRGSFFPNGTDAETQRRWAQGRARREQDRATAYVAKLIAGCRFRSEAQMVDVACEMAVERMGRAPTAAGGTPGGASTPSSGSTSPMWTSRARPVGETSPQ